MLILAPLMAMGLVDPMYKVTTAVIITTFSIPLYSPYGIRPFRSLHISVASTVRLVLLS